MKIVRSVLAIVLGMAVVTVVSEGIEFALVTALNGSVTTDLPRYFAVRNQPGVLAAKLVYNGLGALLGGYVAAAVAGRAPLAHGIVVAVLQLAGLLWGMLFSEYKDTSPTWLWLALAASMTPLIVAGAWLRGRRRPASMRRSAAPAN